METITFDSLNRETASSWNDGVTPATARTYDSAGRLMTLTNTVSQLTYSYDNANQLLSEVQNLGTITAKTNSYTYDSDGQRLKHTYPAGNFITNSYTARHQIGARPEVGRYCQDHFSTFLGKLSALPVPRVWLPRLVEL